MTACEDMFESLGRRHAFPVMSTTTTYHTPSTSSSFRCGGPFVSATLHSFGGEIVVKEALPTGKWDDDEALKERFQKAGAVGIDFEWKPDKTPATNHPISLVQLATEDLALLIRTNTHHVLPQWVRDLLNDPKKAKVTIGFDVSDHAKLQFTFDLECNNVIDLYEISKKNRSVPRGGLKRIAHHFGYFLRKDKKISMSDWSATEPLSDIQVGVEITFTTASAFMVRFITRLMTLSFHFCLWLSWAAY